LTAEELVERLVALENHEVRHLVPSELAPPHPSGEPDFSSLVPGGSK
jgi:hypothetical protein